jgi:hypothetical protein
MGVETSPDFRPYVGPNFPGYLPVRSLQGDAKRQDGEGEHQLAYRARHSNGVGL